MIEDGLRAAEVHAIALVQRGAEVRDGRKMDHAIGATRAEHVFGSALANVHGHELDGARYVRPRPFVDADHLVPAPEQNRRHLAPDRPRDTCDEHLHAARSRAARPSSINDATRSFTWRTSTSMCSSSSLPVPSKRMGSP